MELDFGGNLYPSHLHYTVCSQQRVKVVENKQVQIKVAWPYQCIDEQLSMELDFCIRQQRVKAAAADQKF